MTRHRTATKLAALVVWLLTATPALAIEPQSVARELEPSTVRILAVGAEGIAAGTGFVISEAGHIATNLHVVANHIDAGWDIFVVESGEDLSKRRPAKLIEAYPREDLAILQVDGLGRPPAPLSEADPARPAKGETVFAIGFPEAGVRLGTILETSFTRGTINRVFTGAWWMDGAQIRIIQHSAATNPGNSGGPVVNACGQVIGINSQREMAIMIGPLGLPIVTDFIQGVFFASHVSVLVEKLKTRGIPYAGTGRVCRVFLGVASVNFFFYAVALAALVILLAAAAAWFWPRPVRVVVYRSVYVPRDIARLCVQCWQMLPHRRPRPPRHPGDDPGTGG